MKNPSFFPSVCFAPLFLVAAALLTACTPMDHTNPYDPASSLTTPNKVGFNISNNVTDIGSTTASLTWNRNTEPEFAAYLVLRDTTDPGVPSAISAEMQAELMATNGRETGALYGASAVSALFPKTAAVLKVVAYLPDANLTSFDDSGLTESTIYHYRILTLTKNLRTFAASTNLRLETTPDKTGPTYRFWPVYSPYNLDINRALIDVDYDPTTDYMYIVGTANGLLMSYQVSNFLGTEYFLAGIPVSSGYIDLEQSGHVLYIAGHTTNTNTPTRFRGLVATNGNIYLGVIRGPTGNYGTGGMYCLSNVVGNSGSLFNNPLSSVIQSTVTFFGDWSSLLTVNGGSIFFTGDVVSSVREFPMDGSTSFSYPYQGSDTNNLVNGIAFDDNGRMYTSSLKDNTIRKYNYATGELLWRRGGPGSRPGTFTEIGDVGYYKSGSRERIYVSDPINNRLTVYDEEGNLITWIDTIKVFGREGSQPRGLKIQGSSLYMTVEIGVIRFDL